MTQESLKLKLLACPNCGQTKKFSAYTAPRVFLSRDQGCDYPLSWFYDAGQAFTDGLPQGFQVQCAACRYEAAVAAFAEQYERYVEVERQAHLKAVGDALLAAKRAGFDVRVLTNRKYADVLHAGDLDVQKSK